MSELVVIAYPDEHRAAEAFTALRRAHSGPNLGADTPTALYVTKDSAGQVEVHRSEGLSPGSVLGAGAAGLLVGLVWTIPIVGAAVGAGAGALMGRGADLGVSDDFIAAVSAHLTPASSALFLLLRPVSADETLGAIGKFGGTVLRTELAPDVESRLERSLAFWEAQHAGDLASPGANETTTRATNTGSPPD
jgi:uncharacterized membrane protein